ncbi:class I SAM-dependent methyltransferase [Candidatus Micrarchaeota archaeon CG10_big_fil_rev_8_21_14_0_10_59_7]|nr:MAG: class I SAM-dependent methyltransferase [Candidatus Micrarchaeota archaeon CG10_big_fil_rev_8_21_14_0_10_59_7]
MNSLRSWDAAYERGALAWRGTTDFEPKPALRKGSRVLELGCGNGKNLSALFGKGWNIYAVDFSPEAARQSAELCRKRGEKCLVSVQDVRSLLFRDSFFDAVICFHVMGHLSKTERAKVVSETRRVLKKNGLLFLRVFGEADFRNGKGAKRGDCFVRKGIPTHYFSEKEVTALFRGWRRVSLSSERWGVTYDGKSLPREQIRAVFRK